MPSHAEILERAIVSDLLSDEEPCALFFDLDLLDRRIDALRDAFPDALHTVAVKALPLPKVLAEAVRRGLGLEVASAGELAIARSLAQTDGSDESDGTRPGLQPNRVVFDSPAKTRGEIADALSWGCRLNLDTLQEVDRVARIAGPDPPGPGRIGLRINPALDVADSTIPAAFTGGAHAKFGVRLDRFRDEVVRAFREHRWLDGLHVHIGSQGCQPELLVEGIARIADLADDLRAAGLGPRWIDLGGGLPYAYRPGDRHVPFADYAGALRRSCPRLFDGTYEVLTEFGRSLMAPCGWAASRVESTRTGATDNTAVIHVGADLFVRTAYRPDQWYHAVTVHDAGGAPKPGPLEPWSLAGPLCFAADYVAIGRSLPPIEPGDHVVIEDAGAYTLAMWSKYNSRQAPAVYGYRADGALEVLKPRETIEDVLKFWGG